MDRKLIGVFEMLVDRLSDLETKVDKLTNQVKPLTRHAQKWFSFFTSHGMTCSRDTAQTTTFTTRSAEQPYQVITVCGSDNTMAGMTRIAGRYKHVPKPFLVVDTPVFATDYFRRSLWTAHLYDEGHNKAPVLGVIVWNKEVKDGSALRVIEEVSAVQLVEDGDQSVLVWQDSCMWVYSKPLHCEFKPVGYYALPEGKREGVDLWQNSRTVWECS